MRLRTKLFAAASSLALVGSFAAIGVNNASATAIAGQNVANDHVTCDSLVGTIKFGTALKLGGNPNVTTNPITIKAVLDGCIDPDNLNVGIAPSTLSGVLTSSFVHGTHCAANGQPSDPPNTGSSSCHGLWFGDSVFIKAKSTSVGNKLTSVSASVPCVVGRGINGGSLPPTLIGGTPAPTTITSCDNANPALKSITLSDNPGDNTVAQVFTMDGPDHQSGESGSFGVNDCFGLSGKSTGIVGTVGVTWKNAKNTGKLYQDAGLVTPAVSQFTVNQTSGGEFNAVNDVSHPHTTWSNVTAYAPGAYVEYTNAGSLGLYSNLTTTATNTGHQPGGTTNNYWSYQGPAMNSNSYGGTYGLFQIGTDAVHGQTAATSLSGAFLGTDGGITGTFDGSTGQSEAALGTNCLGSSGIKTLNFGNGGVHLG